VINIFAVARDFVSWSAGHEQTITAPYLAEAIAKSLVSAQASRDTQNMLTRARILVTKTCNEISN
jgi:hypothetical protein